MILTLCLSPSPSLSPSQNSALNLCLEGKVSIVARARAKCWQGYVEVHNEADKKMLQGYVHPSSQLHGGRGDPHQGA